MKQKKITDYLKSLNFLKIVFVIVFFVVLAFNVFSEKTVNTGAGYDGLYYRELVRNFPEMLRSGFSDYKASRVLPFAIAHYLLKTFNIPYGDYTVMITIWCMILSLMILGIVYYFKIVKILSWRGDIGLYGFIILFYNFAILKYIGYYPILTDHFIFPLTIILLYHFLRKQYVSLFILGLAGCFIWPTYSLFIPLLLMNNPVALVSENKIDTKHNEWFWRALKIGLPVFPVVLFVYLIRSQNLWVEKRYLTANIYATFRPYNFVVSIFATIAVYVYYLFILRPINSLVIKSYFKSIFQTKRKQIILTLFFMSLVFIFKFAMTRGNSEPPFPTIRDLLVEFTFRPAVAPFNFVVFALWFLGPIIYFGIDFYTKIFYKFLEIGNGYFLLLVYSIIFLTTAQPRYLTTMLPFFIIALMPILEHIFKNIISSKILILFAVFSLFLSRFWLPIERNPNYMKNGETADEKYPMFVGPWISDYFYLWLTVIGFGLYFFWNRFLLKSMLEPNKPFL